ncbi:MAG: hypothetical protein EOP88_08080 [Verrucomicrobiaceae bacterium]|nr:MAG: hypothetical protein EOP88_08080 [Verrucomicrobiaceae bacterium]
MSLLPIPRAVIPVLSLLLAFHASAADFAVEVLADNPLAHYRLNESPITTGTLATDASGNGRSLTYMGNPAGGVTGMNAADKAVTFTAASQQRLQAPASGAFATLGQAIDNGFTLEFIVKTTIASNANQYLLGAFQNNLKTAIGLQLRANSDGLGGGDIRLFLRDEDGDSRAFFVTSAPALFDGNYHHLVIAYNGADSPVSADTAFYLDGVAIGSGSAIEQNGALNNFTTFSDNPVRIGAGVRAEPATNLFSGTLAEAAFYAAPLSAARVQNHFAAIPNTEVPSVEPAFPLPLSASFLPVSETASGNSFALVSEAQAAPIYHSANDATVVQLTAAALASDVKQVTGTQPAVSTSAPAATPLAVFVGTIGSSTLIDGLVASGKINVAAIQGGWERYQVSIVDEPVAGVGRALVIAGSDRRGTSYGMFALSEAIGVSPWIWWGDVVPRTRPNLHISSGVHDEPTSVVKYRGIFLNDEDWGLKPWASKTFDPAQNDIGPATYHKVFELMTRLRSNYCWPAMHLVTQAFNVYPQNKVVADQHAIVMGSSHHEPMLRNTSEFNEATLGPWNYFTNRNTIYNFWDQRVQTNGRYENLYSIGMRGHDDTAINHGTPAERVQMLQQIFADQREILQNRLGVNPNTVPQVFIPYKEVLGLYQMGLQVPDDVTIMWVDDNHGYIRQLPTQAERQRSGGSGVYYHLSYWGEPQDYLWLCTTPPALVREEMIKAYDYEARRVWIVNVGDIKPGEIGTEFFLEMARNPEAFRNFDQRAWLRSWAGRTFGPSFAEETGDLLNEYYRLNHPVRPEHFNSHTTGFDPVIDGDETQKRLADCAAMVAKGDALLARMPLSLRNAFYQMVLYPVRGAAAMNEKFLHAERSRMFARQGRASTNAAARLATQGQDRINADTAYYNLGMTGGKWNRMMSSRPRAEQGPPWGPTAYNMPVLGSVTAPAGTAVGVAVEGNQRAVTAGETVPLPTFTPYGQQQYFIDVFATGTTPANWTAASSVPWLTLSQTSGTTAADARIQVGIDWPNVPRGHGIRGAIAIISGATVYQVEARARNPMEADAAQVANTFTEDAGKVRIQAENFHRSIPRGNVAWEKRGELGLFGDAVSIQPPTAESIDPAAILANAPSLEYDLYTLSSGPVTVRAFCLPTQRIHPGRGLRYAISINGETPKFIDLQEDEYTDPWRYNIMRNTAQGSTTHEIAAPGRQTLKLWMVDPGVVVDYMDVELDSTRRVLEFEDLTVSSTTGDVHRIFYEGPASNAAAIAYESNAAADQVTYVLPAMEAKTYDLTVRAKRSGNRAKIRLSVASDPAGPFTDVGPEIDLYSTEGYADLAPVRVTFDTPGTKYLRFSVTGKNAASSNWIIVLDRLTLVPVDIKDGMSNLERWRSEFFGIATNTGTAADLADPDGDGVANLLEYAAGDPPTERNPVRATGSLFGNDLSFSFARSRIAEGITYRVERSLDLIEPWLEIWNSQGKSLPPGNEPAPWISVVSTDPVNSSPRQFMRLKVTRP